MRKKYSTPETLVLTIDMQKLMAGSGPTGGDQHNPGIGSRRGTRRQQWDEWEDEEEADDEG